MTDAASNNRSASKLLDCHRNRGLPQGGNCFCLIVGAIGLSSRRRCHISCAVVQSQILQHQFADNFPTERHQRQSTPWMGCAAGEVKTFYVAIPIGRPAEMPPFGCCYQFRRCCRRWHYKPICRSAGVKRFSTTIRLLRSVKPQRFSNVVIN